MFEARSRRSPPGIQQDRHRLGKAELDGAVGKVQGVGEHRQRDVDGRDEGAQQVSFWCQSAWVGFLSEIMRVGWKRINTARAAIWPPVQRRQKLRSGAGA